jgi:gluconolactonase
MRGRRVEQGLRLPSGLRAVSEGLDHPEGICWCPSAEVLYAGGESGQLYRLALAGGPPAVVARVEGGFFLGLAVDAAGRVYVCDINNQCVHRIDPHVAVQRHGEPIGYPNWPVFGADGTLYVSDSGSWDADDGGIMQISPAGRTERLPTPALRFPNGMALRDGWLYVAESAWPGIVRVPLSGGEPEVVVALDRVVPDGLAFDAEGGLWISCWQPNRILRLCPDGRLDTIADDWSGIHVLSPNNLAFAGAALDELVFPALAGDFVRAFRPGVSGQPLEHPELHP